jgi:3-hydroxyisobutyrate dehydrogenase-like beta-hydroxyacid dehydrogenase
MRIGLIGAGMMGHGLAINLLKHGNGVIVIAHRNRDPIIDLVARGATEARDLTHVAQEAAVILFCLPASKVVEDTINRLRPHLRSHHILIDTGTSEPDATRRLARELSHLGVGYADAPLTGGPEQAAAAELGVLCGADQKTFAVVAPVLKCFATTVRHVGPPGSGHAAKLISNYLVTGMIALVTQAFGAARKAEINWRDLYEAMLNGSGNSGVLRKMVAPALEGNFDGYRFSIANAAKDIGYYADMAEKLGCSSQLTEAVTEVFVNAMETGQGKRNVSQLLNPRTFPV